MYMWIVDKKGDSFQFNPEHLSSYATQNYDEKTLTQDFILNLQNGVVCITRGTEDFYNEVLKELEEHWRLNIEELKETSHSLAYIRYQADGEIYGVPEAAQCDELKVYYPGVNYQ